MAKEPQQQLPRDPKFRLALGAALQRAARRNPKQREQLNKSAQALAMSADLLENGPPTSRAPALQKPPEDPSPA